MDAVITALILLVHSSAAVEVDTSWQAMEKAAMVWVYIMYGITASIIILHIVTFQHKL